MANELFSIMGKIGADNAEAFRAMDEAVEKAKDTDSILSRIGSGFESTLSTIGGATSGLLNSVGNGVNSFGETVLKTGDKFNGMAEKASSSFTAIGEGATKLGKTLTNKVTKPILGVVSALGGLTLAKGWSRITDIEEATVKLKALGNTTKQVGQIMDNANNAVLGTAHSLNEAATVAAQANASGIKAGSEMEAYLRRVADASSYAGVSMGEMGSIFNKVLTGGKAQAEELNQLADRSVPIFDMLAESMGVTTDEVRKLASEGKITADVLMEAFDSIEGYAKDSAKTVGGAWSLVMSSIGRIGANIFGEFDEDVGEVTGLLAVIRDSLISVKDALLPIESLSKEAGKTLADMAQEPLKKLQEQVEAWSNLDEGIQRTILGQIANATALAAIFPVLITAVGGLLTVGGKAGLMFTGLGKGVSKLTKNLVKTTGGIGKFATRLAAVGTSGSAFNKVMQGASASVLGFTKVIGGFLVTVAGLGASGALMTAIGGAVALFGLLPEGMNKALNEALEAVRTKVPQMLSNLSDMIEERLPEIMKRGAENIANIFNSLAEVMPSLSELGQTILQGLLDGMTQDGQMVFDAVINFLTSLAQGFVDALPLIFELGGLFITQLSQSMTNNSEAIVAMAIDLIEALALGIIEAIPALAEAAVNIISGLISGISENTDKMKEMAETIVEALKTSFEENSQAWMLIGGLIVGKIALGIAMSAGVKLIPAAIKGIATFATGVIGAKGLLLAAAIAIMVAFIAKIVEHWPEIKAKGREILNKLWDGLKSIWESVRSWFSDKMDAFKEFAGKVNLFEIGKNILQGLWDGLKNIWGSVSGWFSDKMNSLKERAQRILSIFSPSRFFEWIGEMLFKGLGLGMENEAPKAEKSMVHALDHIKKTAEGYHFANPGYSLPIDASGSVSSANANAIEEQEFQGHMLTFFDRVTDLLSALLDKDIDVYMDAKKVSEQIREPLNHLNDIYDARGRRIDGRPSFA